MGNIFNQHFVSPAERKKREPKNSPTYRCACKQVFSGVGLYKSHRDTCVAHMEFVARMKKAVPRG
jgi:hypothetical protein